MFKSNHVGRPSNRELKTRKIKKAIVILLPVIIIFIGIIVISKGNLKSLMGNSVTTEYYCEDESYNLDGRECVKTITVEPNLLGDANKDGKININDVTAIQKAISSNNTSDIIYVADVNGDKLVNETDLKMIQSFLNGESDQSTVGHTENIGVSLVCPSDFTIDNKVCKKQDKVQAIAGERLQDDDKKASNSSNNSSVNSQDDTKKEENSNSKIEANNNTYTITFDANGGTGKMDDIIIDEKITSIPENKFVNSKARFKGWTVYNKTTGKWLIYLSKKESIFAEINQTSANYYSPRLLNDKASISLIPANSGDELVFYAQWENIFYVKFDANGGQGTMPVQEIKYGVATKINKNKFTKSGNKYDAWFLYSNTEKKYACYLDKDKTKQGYTTNENCKKYGYVMYQDQQEINSLANPGETITFKARWIDYFTLYYSSNGGQGTMSSQKITYGKSTQTKKNTFTKSGYVFGGWYVWNANKQQYACYLNKDKTKKGYTTNENCEKYGYVVYKNQATVAKTGQLGEAIWFVAKWNVDYSCSSCQAPVYVYIGQLQGSTSLPKGSVVHTDVTFNVLDKSKPYYYKWRTYKNGSLNTESSCLKVKNAVKDLTVIDGTKKGTVTVYSDSSCKNKVTKIPLATSQTFTCSNCNVANNNSNSSSSSNNSNTSSSSNSTTSNSSNKSTKKKYTCPSGYYKHSKYGCVKQTTIKCNKGIYYGSKGKCKISNVKYTESCNAVKNSKVTIGYTCPITNKMNPIGGRINSASAKSACNLSCYGYKDKYVTPSCTGNGKFDSSKKLCLDINKKPNKSACPTGYKYNKNNNLCEK